MRKLLINILFRLIDRSETYGGINDEQIVDWLARQWQQPGFREYFRKRDLQILKAIGTGLDQRAYDSYLGQRLELLYLLEKSDRAFRAVSAHKKKMEDLTNKGGK